MKLLILSPAFYFLVSLLIIFKIGQKSSRQFRRLVIAWSLLFYLFTTPFIPHAMIGWWENQYSPVNLQNLDDNHTYKILVLGAGHGNDERLVDLTRINSHARARINEGVRIANHLHQSHLFTSGHSGNDNTPTGIVMRNAAIQLGFNPYRISVQAEPHNTKSEAASFYDTFFQEEDTLILVTSAQHLPRALNHFKRAGIENIIPAPCDYVTFRNNESYKFGHFIPKLHYLRNMTHFNKEWVGVLFNL